MSSPAASSSSLTHGSLSPDLMLPAAPELKALCRHSMAVCEMVRNMKLVIHDRPRPHGIGHIEEVRVGAARKSGLQCLANDRANTVAARQIRSIQGITPTRHHARDGRVCCLPYGRRRAGRDARRGRRISSAIAARTSRRLREPSRSRPFHSWPQRSRSSDG